MDQLDILKKQWKSQESGLPVYNKEKLTGLLLNNSTNIVKWIFYIAICEFVLFASLNLFMLGSKSQQQGIEIMGPYTYWISYAIHYIAIFIFMFLFYKNYKNISTVQPVRSHMKNILKTRRTMKQYIWYNILYIIVFTIVYTAFMMNDSPIWISIIEENNVKDTTLFYSIVLGTVFIFMVLLCGLMYLFYSLLYGILLRKLNKNYKELKTME